MAKIDLSEKLKISSNDMSDLSEMRIPLVWMLSSVFIVSAISWGLTSMMTKLVLHSNHYLFSAMDNVQLFSPGNLLFLCVIVGFACIRAFLYQFTWFQDACGDGTSRAIAYFQLTYQQKVSTATIFKDTYSVGNFFVALKRILVTIMTLGAGGSGGLEGPAIPIGESLGSGVAKLFHVRDIVWLRILQMCGISAAVTTLLHAPLTGAIFALELVFGCKFVYRILTYSFLASLIAFILSNHLLEAHALFSVPAHAIKYSLYEYILVIVVTVFASIPSGVGLLVIFHIIRRLFSHLPVVSHAPLGALICALTAISMWLYFDIHPSHILGVGEETISLLFSDHPNDPLLLQWHILFAIVVLKIFLTGFTIISGGSAGLLVPAVFVGALSSSGLFFLFSDLQLLPLIDGLHHLFMVTGVASSLICVMDLPIATVLFVGELFGISFIAPCIVAVGISRTLAKVIKDTLPKN